MNRLIELHKTYKEKRASHKSEHKYDVWNAFVATEDPTTLIDCSAEKSYDSFKHLVNGDLLLYAEVANSTPFEGHVIEEGCEDMVRLNARTKSAMGMEEIVRMRKRAVGVQLRHHSPFYYPDAKTVGCVAKAGLINDKWEGHPYKSLAILCWISPTWFDSLKNNDDMAYISYNECFKKEICCKCGKTFGYGDELCEHLGGGRGNYVRGLEILSEFAYFNWFTIRK